MLTRESARRRQPSNRPTLRPGHSFHFSKKKIHDFSTLAVDDQGCWGVTIIVIIHNHYAGHR